MKLEVACFSNFSEAIFCIVLHIIIHFSKVQCQNFRGTMVNSLDKMNKMHLMTLNAISNYGELVYTLL